jgi:hypothetical protein
MPYKSVEDRRNWERKRHKPRAGNGNQKETKANRNSLREFLARPPENKVVEFVPKEETESGYTGRLNLARR